MVQTDAERKAKRKAYHSTPEYKARDKERNSRPERKAQKKEHARRPEVRAKKKEYANRPKVKAKDKERRDKPENKAKAKERDSRPETKAKKKEYKDRVRLKVLQYYSKQLSKSNIPCCRCCGENFHIDFLALDHIAGRMEMDSEAELVKLGYSSSWNVGQLIRWIIKNNFPKGFQILCHKCNFAKGIKRNNNKCPHQQ